MRLKGWIIWTIMGMLVLGGSMLAAESQGKTEILWDTYGVPHIFAENTEGLFYAYGWAQMQNHGDLILELYAEARGRASEFLGKDHLETDTIVRTMGIPQRAKKWLKAYSPEFQGYLRAFARGMNDYAAKHKDKINKERQPVLPVTAEDPLAHTQRVIHLSFLAGRSLGEAEQWDPDPPGSNGWAIAPSRSKSGNAMLLINPHLQWKGFHRWFEAHLKGPGIDATGVTLVGMPMHIMAFNDHMGWTHTVNVHDGADLYKLTKSKGGYIFDGKIHAFDTRVERIKIKQEDGTFEEKRLEILESVHGPVVKQKKNHALALRVVGLDRPLTWKQRFEMAKATDLESFKKALAIHHVPFLNTIYAGRDGHIMLLHNALLPKRGKGDWATWSGIVPGNTSETLWTEYHRLDELPQITDPKTGWLQNANDPPWTCTYPMILKPGDYPAYTSLPLKKYEELALNGFRAIRCSRLLHEDESISFDEMVQYKHSTRMELADRLLDDLAAAVKVHGNETAKAAMKLLEGWDRHADADSKGAVMFQAWVFQVMRRLEFKTRWVDGDVFTAPDGIKDPKMAADALARAADGVRVFFGKPDIAWGDVHRIRVGDKDLPASGAPGYLGVARPFYFAPDEDKKWGVRGGDTYVAAIEFSKPMRARAILSYGNASQTGSPYIGDQAELVIKNKLRPAWRSRKDIEKNLAKKENLKSSSSCPVKS